MGLGTTTKGSIGIGTTVGINFCIPSQYGVLIINLVGSLIHSTQCIETRHSMYWGLGGGHILSPIQVKSS